MAYSANNPFAAAAATPRSFGMFGRTASDANAITQANLWESQQGSSRSAGGAQDPAQANWQNAMKNTEGRGDAVMSDPYTQAALDRFKGVLGGDVPYSAQVQSQLLSRQADAGASALGAQREMLAEQMGALGGSMADPSAQAALRRLMATNQAQNNANLGDMNTKATLTNFGARNDAAGNLASIRGSQLGMANGQYNQAAQMYANQQISGPRTDAAPTQQGGGMDQNFMAWLMAQGQQNNAGQQGQQKAAPVKPAPNINQSGGVGAAAYGPKAQVGYRVATPNYANKPNPVTNINQYGGVGSLAYGPTAASYGMTTDQRTQLSAANSVYGQLTTRR